MSELSDPLPLPQATQILNERADLLTAWDAINDWYSEAVSPNGVYRGAGFRHFAGPILLALKYLVLEFKLWAKDLEQDKSDTRERLASAVQAVMAALAWARKQHGVDALIEEFNQSSLSMAMFIANFDYDWLLPGKMANLSGPKLPQVTIPAAHGHLRRCMAMWNVILLYITKYPDLKVTTTKPVKEKIKYLNEQIQAQLPDAGQSSTKRPGEGSLSPRRSKSPPATQNPMALLTVSLEDRRLYLNRYDRSIGIAPLDGLTKSPVPISADNVMTLLHRHWLDDVIINGYLGLVCHKANGHFEPGTPSLPQSPKWHAWSSHWLTGNDDSGSWPPPAYPDAQVQNIAHHFFPRHWVNHWLMFHLYSSDQGRSWRAEFWSSLGGYRRAIQEEWPIITTALSSLSDGLDLSDIEVESPEGQPMQQNSDDCGVLLLCAARWTCEGWPLSSIRVKDCPELRERMAVELEKWRLE